ncbi:MAG: histidinol-phosphate transaminase [Chloroflexi bacterium]|nr:histidinol-phosphate transaminase [Chloroflexota bacterium]
MTREDIESLARDGVLEEASVIDFSVTTNPLGPSPAARAALAAVDIQRYPDSEATELRCELGRRLGVDVDNLIVGNGSVELIWLVCSAYLRAGDASLIIGPTFGEYETASRIFGADVTFYLAQEEDDFSPDLDVATRLIHEISPRLVFLCNPNNPTGYHMQSDQVARVVDAGCDSLVVVDEAFATLADSRSASEALARRPNVVLLRSMTKDYALAGLRIGYAVASAEIIDVLRRARPPWTVNSCAQAAALASLRDESYLSRSRHEIDAAKLYLVARLVELGLKVVPSQANFLLVKVGDAAAFRKKLLRKGFCARDCTSFGLREYVRIGVRTREECHELVVAMREVM